MILKRLFVLIRPYSTVDVLMLLMLAKCLNHPPSLLLDLRDAYYAVVYLLLWAFLSLLLEAEHKHPYRGQVTHAIPLIAFFLAAFACAARTPMSLAPLALLGISAWLYTKKNVSVVIGHISCFLRGTYQASLFLLGMLLYGHSTLAEQPLLIVLAIFLLYSGRNLVADIRDIAFDETTIPARYDRRTSYIISLACYVLAGCVLLIAFSSISVVFPIIVMALLMIVYDDAYNLHRCSILLTSFISCNIVLTTQSIPLVYSHMLFLGGMVNLVTYNLTPRLSNPTPQIQPKVRILFGRSSD